MTYFQFYDAAALYCLDKPDAANAALEAAIAKLAALLKPGHRRLVAGCGLYKIGWVHEGKGDRGAANKAWQRAGVEFRAARTMAQLEHPTTANGETVMRIAADWIERVKAAE